MSMAYMPVYADVPNDLGEFEVDHWEAVELLDSKPPTCPHGFTGPHSAAGMTPRAADDHCSGPGSWYPAAGDQP